MGCIPLWQPGKYDLMSRPIEVLNFKPLPNEYNYSMSKLGCTRWYGGFNRQKNKNNDYGFLSDNEVGGVFFHSSQLQQDDLLFLEKISDQGKGIIVNYKINYNAKKEKYQVTEIKLKKVIALKTVLLSSNKLSKLAECVLRFKNGQMALV